AFEAAAPSGPLAHVLDYSVAPIVSSDIVGSPASCTFDSPLTLALGSLVKVFGGYDNEGGYSHRLVDLAALAGAAGAGKGEGGESPRPRGSGSVGGQTGPGASGYERADGRRSHH